MPNRYYVFALLFAVLVACKDDNDRSGQELTIADFEQNLSADMSYDAIVSTFGSPTGDIGSGIHIYVYRFNDSTEIWIGYADQILYARHMDENQQLIKDLI